MIKFFPFVSLLIFVSACSKPTPPPKGFATWDEVRSAADAFVLQGKTNEMFIHVNFDGVPPSEMQNIKSILGNWQGIPKGFKLSDIKVVDFNEYKTFEREFFTNLPDSMRDSLLSAVRWNIQPEKIIIYNFAGASPTTTNASNQFSAGAYQTNGLWYFSTSYNVN